MGAYACREQCSGRRDCGGYGFTVAESCYIYNINEAIINQHLSDNWYWTDSGLTFYSKICAYDVGASDLRCNAYSNRQYTNKIMNGKWRIAGTSTGVPNLPPSECQSWCSLYTGCKSVSYELRNSDGAAYCRLYNTTIEDLLEAGLEGEVWNNTGTSYTYTVYDRYCEDGRPYLPVGAEPFAFTSQEVKETGGRVSVHVDYIVCGAEVTDQHLLMNTSIVAALQHSHSNQMFSIYHIYCEVDVVDDELDTAHYNILGNENNKDVISETGVDDVTSNNDVMFNMEVIGAEGVIPADAELTLSITCSDPV